MSGLGSVALGGTFLKAVLNGASKLELPCDVLGSCTTKLFRRTLGV